MNRRSVFYLIFIAIISINVNAQWNPTPNDTLISPRINHDNSVTISIYAPKASEVTISGDWRPTWGVDKLKKDSIGVWSFTIDPLKPDFYSYTLTVDGVRTFDPKNVEFKPGVSSMENMFEVPGKENDFQNNNMVPHGEIRSVWYYSTTMGKQRRMHIYTPPGYENKKEKYPVLYLQHGAGDDDAGWYTIGRAGFILDNLVASGKAKPMIIVMADGTRSRSVRYAAGESFEKMMMSDQFGDDLHKDIIPFVEKNYMVINDRKSRAFAGLSMGGLQVLWFGLPRYDKFAYFGIFSMGIAPEITDVYKKKAESFFRDPEQTNKDVKLLWIGSGKNDFLIQGVHNMTKLFDDQNIKYTYKETEGGHTWINWRKYLNEFAPLLFR